MDRSIEAFMMPAPATIHACMPVRECDYEFETLIDRKTKRSAHACTHAYALYNICALITHTQTNLRHVHMYMHTHTCTCTCTNGHTHTLTHTHTHTHTHAHTHTGMPRWHTCTCTHTHTVKAIL